jgi:hypothetical protein
MFILGSQCSKLKRTSTNTHHHTDERRILRCPKLSYGTRNGGSKEMTEVLFNHSTKLSKKTFSTYLSSML